MSKQLDNGFVLGDTLVIDPYGKDLVMHGHIACMGDIIVRVFKILECSGADSADPLVRTVEYAYNVWLYGANNIFRYDNQHRGGLGAHLDGHHKHEFDWRTGVQTGEPKWVGENWPTLGEVLSEAHDWHTRHYSEIPCPHCEPDLSQMPSALEKPPPRPLS